MGGREATKQPRTVLPSTHRCSVGPLSCAMASPSGARLPQHVLLHVLGNNQGVVDNSADREREREKRYQGRRPSRICTTSLRNTLPMSNGISLVIIVFV